MATNADLYSTIVSADSGWRVNDVVGLAYTTIYWIRIILNAEHIIIKCEYRVDVIVAVVLDSNSKNIALTNIYLAKVERLRLNGEVVSDFGGCSVNSNSLSLGILAGESDSTSLGLGSCGSHIGNSHSSTCCSIGSSNSSWSHCEALAGSKSDVASQV